MSEREFREAVRAEDIRAFGPGVAAKLEQAHPLSDADLDEFARQWHLKMATTGHHAEILTPLPRRVRARLAVTRAVDSIGIRLAGRWPGLAGRWWRLTGKRRWK